MRPGDHPEFFRRPAPEGRSRESTIRLDAQGRFWHEGRPVLHEGMAAAFHSWIGRHPDDGRYILSNGYDWTYFAVEDAPYTVRAIRIGSDGIVLSLSDGDEQTWNPTRSRVGADDGLYALVKQGSPGGPFEAKFTRHAQAALAPVLLDGDPPAVKIGGAVYVLGAKRTSFG